MNPDALAEIEEQFKSRVDGIILRRIKNGRETSACPAGFKGVNLKFNFFSDELKNACSQSFGGPAAKSEKEIEGLFRYLKQQGVLCSSVLLLSKYSSTQQRRQQLDGSPGPLY